MIVFINGPFGVGKTTSARLVVKRLRRGVIFDPEIIGDTLKTLLGAFRPVEDFQEYGCWAFLTVLTAGVLVLVLRRATVIPMTVCDLARWQYITKALQNLNTTVICVRLVCSPETLRQRILGRPQSEGCHAWCLSHLDSGIALMNDPQYGKAIDTEGQAPEQVAGKIMHLVAQSRAGR